MRTGTQVFLPRGGPAWSWPDLDGKFKNMSLLVDGRLAMAAAAEPKLMLVFFLFLVWNSEPFRKGGHLER
jgi:hypothetical protein